MEAGPVLPFFFRKLYCALRNGGARKASASFTLSLWEVIVVAYQTKLLLTSSGKKNKLW